MARAAALLLKQIISSQVGQQGLYRPAQQLCSLRLFASCIDYPDDSARRQSRLSQPRQLLIQSPVRATGYAVGTTDAGCALTAAFSPLITTNNNLRCQVLLTRIAAQSTAVHHVHTSPAPQQAWSSYHCSWFCTVVLLPKSIRGRKTSPDMVVQEVEHRPPHDKEHGPSSAGTARRDQKPGSHAAPQVIDLLAVLQLVHDTYMKHIRRDPGPAPILSWPVGTHRWTSF